MLVRIKDDYGEANMIPADLLDQLREKDPGLWERMRRMPIYVHRDSSLTVDLTKSDNTELVAAWLQHCLQEAIRARGWRYGIDYDTDRVCATVLKNIDSAWKLIGVGYGSTEAEALMRAYLSALSGERI